MIDPAEAASRRAERLVRCYPRAWRVRYGEEFTQFLADDIAERPHSVTRTADVLRSGTLARVTYAGLAGDALEPQQQMRAGLGVVGLSASAFLAAGVAIWSQLAIGWQWSSPATTATKVGMLMMSGAILAFVLAAVLAALPLAWVTLRELVSGDRRRLVLPLIAVSVGTFVLVTGSIHFGQHGWPGTRGHPWSGRGLVPGSVARFAWAATLSITSYWAHPGRLASFPAAEIAWMLLSPLALAAAVIGAATTFRRLPLEPRVLRFESWLGLTAAIVMVGFLTGASSWVISNGPDPHSLFRVGLIDFLGVTVMAAALTLAYRAAHRTLGASRRHTPTT